jgi:hypothetical protein
MAARRAERQHNLRVRPHAPTRSSFKSWLALPLPNADQTGRSVPSYVQVTVVAAASATVLPTPK